MSLATWVRERRKLSASLVMMLTVTPPPARARSKARVSARLSTRSPRCRIAGTSSGRRPATPPPCSRGAPAKASAGTSRCGAERTRHAAGVQHAGEGRPEAAEHAAERIGDRRQHEAPHRDLGEVGEDRGDEVAHAELAGLHELAHRVLGAAEAADQRVADALAGLLRLVGVVAHRLGRELPAGLRRLGRFRHLRRRRGAGAAGLADRVAELLRRDRRPAERGLRLLGRALHRVAQRLQRGERRGGGRRPRQRRRPRARRPGRWPRRRRPRSRRRPSRRGSPPRSRRAWSRLHAGDAVEAARSRHAGSRPSCAGCRRARSASRPRSSPRPTAATAPATGRRA